LRGNHDSGVTDSLPSICASFTKAVLHCICRCDTPLWYFVLVILLRTGRSRVSKKFCSRSQSKTSWPPLDYCICIFTYS